MLEKTCADNQLPKTRGAGAWDPRVEDQGGVLQCPPDIPCGQQHPVPSTQDFGAGAGWPLLCGQLECRGASADLVRATRVPRCLSGQQVYSAEPRDRRGGAWNFGVATRSKILVVMLRDLVRARKSEGHVLALDQEILWRAGNREFELVVSILLKPER